MGDAWDCPIQICGPASRLPAHRDEDRRTDRQSSDKPSRSRQSRPVAAEPPIPLRSHPAISETDAAKVPARYPNAPPCPKMRNRCPPKLLPEPTATYRLFHHATRYITYASH